MSLEGFKNSGKKDEVITTFIQDFLILFEAVNLVTIHSRFSANGFDIVRDWNIVLTLAEKQKIALVRLFFYCPKFAILGNIILIVQMNVLVH